MKKIRLNIRFEKCLLILVFMCFELHSINYKFLSDKDIVSSSWKATINFRENDFEHEIKYPLFSGKAYYQKGISIPLRENITMYVDSVWNYASFKLGVDQFLFPEMKINCQLKVYGDEKLIYCSPNLTEKSIPVKVLLPLAGLKLLKFELSEKNKFVFDSPDNWADLNYIGVDLTNFIWSKSKLNIALDKYSIKTVNENIGMEIHPIALPSSTWVIKYLADCGRDSEGMILAGCFNNNLYALTPQGKSLWNIKLEGTPHEIYSVSEGDDFKIAVLSWSLNTDLTIIDAYGKIIKTIYGENRIQTMSSYLNSFFTLDINNKLNQYTSAGLLIRSLKAPNLKGRPMVLKIFNIPEVNDYRILIGTTSTLACYDKDLNFIWEKSINSFNTFLSSTHDVLLSNVKGKTSFIIGSRPGSVSMLDYMGNIIWSDRYSGRGHSAPEIAKGTFSGYNKNEIVSVSSAGIFQLLNINGQLIKRWEKKLPFVDIDKICKRVKNGNESIVAASMGPRDNNIYLLQFNNKSANLGLDLIPEFRNDYVTPTLTSIKNDIDSCKFYFKNTKSKYVSFLFDPFGGNFTNPKAFYNSKCLLEAQQRLIKIKKFTDEYSGNNIHFLPMFDLWSSVYHKERTQIIDTDLNMNLLKDVEKMKLPFTLLAMHGDRVIPIEILESIIKQNKNTLVALQFSEAIGMVDYKKSVLKLAKDNGIKVLFGIHLDYWLNVTQRKEEFDILFNKKYMGVLIPILKSNPSSFDLNLMSTLGMWQNKFITDWGVASQHWSWNWYTRNIDDMFPIDLLFKHDFQAASLGASWFLPEGDFMQGDKLLETYFQARYPFYELLKKGVFSIDSIGQNQRISPVKIGYNKNDKYHFINNYSPECFLTTGLKDGLLQPTPVNSFSKEISGVDRYIDVLFPRMPYGYVLILPDDKLPEMSIGWFTDGLSLYKNGQKQLNTNLLVNELKESTLNFLVQTEDAFLSVQKIGENYLIYITTNENLHPTTEDITLKFNPNFENNEKQIVLKDIVKNKIITINNASLKLRLMPGEIKVLLLKKV